MELSFRKSFYMVRKGQSESIMDDFLEFLMLLDRIMEERYHHLIDIYPGEFFQKYPCYRDRMGDIRIFFVIAHLSFMAESCDIECQGNFFDILFKDFLLFRSSLFW